VDAYNEDDVFGVIFGKNHDKNNLFCLNKKLNN